MSQINVTLDQLATIFESTETKRFKAAEDAIYEAAALGTTVIARAAPVDVGVLKNSVRVQRTPKGAEIAISAPYAGVIERGARPFTPPLAPLVAYAERHGAESPWAMAKAIQLKFSQEGIKPRFFVRSSMPALCDILGRLEREALEKGG